MDSLLEELERMSVNAIDSFLDEVNEDDIKRWQTLFGMRHEEARDSIQRYREDIDRQRFSDELWHDIQASKEVQGHDRESCEYDLFRRSRVKSAIPPAPVSHPSNILRGLILGGPLATPEHIQSIAGLTNPPTTTTAESSDPTTSSTFCYITAAEEHLILQGLLNLNISYEPHFITINMASKDLQPTSASPTLGIKEPTLPQHRPEKSTDLVLQDEYPVYYFFYGTLAEPEILQRVLELGEQVPVLQKAYVKGAEVKMMGRYKALVDSEVEARVDGWAFLVEDEGQELKLRVYETRMYEVVRCDVWLVGEGGVVKGLTFRAAI
ncbi:hypothetical protein D6C86_01079 [Aureobasidium pullulans]|uniref:Putative gamma-glutamylcyclotransferase n=1 Tax=Aureobasidium pullulans TaxID=5580 RepID=A0A4V4KWU2_AURPU|nr:hypothetical protein D6C94_02321 [Aureobasidium pullulans]THZ48094.1 hypothetical protein D6C87_00988 [Aureobasidium pullulans]THZ66926.1 hypothetical protein D6C86_01079 [Aureobasidium pullulans]THZ91174.1 hypothetical protein D6C88_03710 [Aureobasidium pullulans]